VNHFAFRVGEFTDLKLLHQRLGAMDGININPISHGNTLSLYFNDPESNGLEVLWDTPWHVAQPQGEPWDISMNKEQALDWVKAQFGKEESFQLQADYYAQRHGDATT
jgi:catechol 2,3-dioxygenase